jgi:hypothetical protein
MSKPIKYKYRFRPGFESNYLLLEFISNVENENFGTDLFDAIRVTNPKIVGKQDLWMNDEFIYTINSDLGKFILSKDVWDLAFIMAGENQSCIRQLNDLLSNDYRFEKVEVDFNNFKLIENAGS